MNVFEGLETLPQPYIASSLAIGTFDGVHIGHQAIIRTAVEDAHAHGRPAIVLTFDRHPSELLAPDRVPGLLTTPNQRNAYISALGADSLVILRFDQALSQLPPNAFLQSIVKDQLGAQAIVVGVDFCFGKGRAGDVAYLTAAQAEFGFTLHALQPVMVGDLPASSTRIRERLRAGDIAGAETLLNHPFLLAGTVVGGQKLGRTLGYPTANLQLATRQVVPADGIYAVQAILDDGQVVGGACSIGNRPTIEGAGRAIETYLLDFSADIYGRGMELRFVKRLREELKFDSLDALKVQMALDVRAAHAALKEGSQ
ncbi:MAG: adenylyltransferase/riboflavin kinase [Chthonomonadaceae bacterium]|nr:adenylyltransferase/riboflavin kinase [Chthonomonadaceae bacterium]